MHRLTELERATRVPVGDVIVRWRDTERSTVILAGLVVIEIADDKRE